MSEQVTYTAVDYVVAAIILLVPMSIGIWYAVKDAHNSTRVEYLLGGRQMSIFPVTMSTFITYMSAVSLMGSPAEAFFFGAIGYVGYIGVASSYVIGYFTFVPLLYPLHLTSVYDYIKRRYRSETVHMLSTIIGMLRTLFYQAVVLLSPALALQACADLPLWMSIAGIGIIGTVYTTIGGFKSVIWTDVFQTVVIFIGIFSIITIAFLKVGGIDEIWRLCEEGGRTKMDKVSLDPTIRHTLWSQLIGFCFMWTSNTLSQASVQRISSMPTLRGSRLIYLLNVPLQLIYGAVNFLIGLAIFAYYSSRECDPYDAGLITNRNQIAPYFVLHAMSKIPGMAGLYTGVLCCGSLSTLSSGINAMAANTVEDILHRPLRTVKEATVTFITKICVLVYGIFIVGLAYSAQSIDGPVTQLAGAVFGAFGSPLLGIIVIGSCVPWVNKFGASAGLVVSLAYNLWISVGNLNYGNPLKPLPPITTENCFEPTQVSNSSSSYYGVTHETVNSFNDTLENTSKYSIIFTSTANNTSNMRSTTSNDTFLLYNISYEWYTPMGFAVCVITCLIVSYFTNLKRQSKSESGKSCYTEAKYIIPCLRRFWGMGDMTKSCNEFDAEGKEAKQSTPMRDSDSEDENGNIEIENVFPLLEKPFEK
ncbi:sodium-coupled monocarboxylate transporter 1 [Plakobranchus ocellatus]|uniref:Sodium-coupled monocarboxylate transporter 1 n=1 Tax=Plakobranchus ocellatus TaxID=259542 RepID=A0AAV4DKQ9_9GAST|nr:sodium-coupled monocarboxylate transporter 1 [Plakobranchus ocellatus]